MFTEQRVIDCLTNLVQFEDVADPSYGSLDNSLLTSDTGRIVSSAHPLATVENLYNTAPEFGKYNYQPWAAGNALKAGNVVKFNNQLYRVRADITAIENTFNPIAAPASFEQTNPFNAWLQDLRRQASIELVSKLVEMKKLNEAGKTLLESQRLYEGGGLFSDRVINKGNFVGFEIGLRPNENIQTVITEIGIQLDTAILVPIYLYHTSLAEPISITNINARGGLNFNWTAVTIMLNSVDYSSTGHDSGGLFYLGYYQDDLDAAQALNRQFDVGSAPCSTCNQFNIQAFARWSKRLSVRAILVDPSDLNDDKTLFDPLQVEYTPNYNWGINLAVTVNCDISNFICHNRLVFADSMAKMLALKCLQKIGFSTRITAIAENTKQLALSELNTDPKSSSFYSEYMLALKALDIDFGGFDDDCLPCAARRFSMRYGSI